MKFKTMRLYFVSFVLLAAWLGCMLPASAQPSPFNKLWMRAFAVGPTINGLFYESEEGDYQEVPLQPFRSSILISIAYPGASLPLYTIFIDPETGIERYVESAEVVIPKDCHQLSFIVLPRGVVDGIRQFDTIVYDDSADDFPLNSVRLINLSPFEVAARFGDKAFKTAPGEFTIQPVTVDEKSRVLAVAGQLSSTKDGHDLLKFYQGPISVPVGRRLTMLAVYSLEGMRTHGYEISKDAQGEDELRYIVVKWLDRPLVPRQ